MAVRQPESSEYSTSPYVGTGDPLQTDARILPFKRRLEVLSEGEQPPVATLDTPTYLAAMSLQAMGSDASGPATQTLAGNNGNSYYGSPMSVPGSQLKNSPPRTPAAQSLQVLALQHPGLGFNLGYTVPVPVNNDRPTPVYPVNWDPTLHRY